MLLSASTKYAFQVLKMFLIDFLLYDHGVFFCFFFFVIRRAFIVSEAETNGPSLANVVLHSCAKAFQFSEFNYPEKI